MRATRGELYRQLVRESTTCERCGANKGEKCRTTLSEHKGKIMNIVLHTCRYEMYKEMNK